MKTSPNPRPAVSAGSKPISRMGCLLAFSGWLVIMTIPLFALVLAVKGELTWRRGDFVEDRIWLVNNSAETGQDEARGLGYSSSRIISDQTQVDGPICVRTRVQFWLWKGRSETVEFCDCYTPAAGGGYESNGSCPS
jgi:hypothetical protein